MTIETFNIEGLLLFSPKVFADDRGYFFESFNQAGFEKAVGHTVDFCQDNESYSHKNVLRGLHFQKPPYAQGKLVRVTRGAVLDVAVDLRKDSKTYGQHVKVLVTAENKKQFWVPAGFAHGFITLTDDTIFNYKCTNYYNQESEGGLNWNDPTLNIDWENEGLPLLSAKDAVDIDFNQFITPF
ncbi:MAG: dTDP-4-dehydrorhamnose 3,5-epimerase [Crocinitomix sp.]|nr:dTDP-4-dehydrorhamnose 3,5-epimerase [Crocinitomix sp.]